MSGPTCGSAGFRHCLSAVAVDSKVWRPNGVLGWGAGRLSSDRGTCSAVDLAEDAGWGGPGKAQESSGSLPDGTLLARTGILSACWLRVLAQSLEIHEEVLFRALFGLIFLVAMAHLKRSTGP